MSWKLFLDAGRLPEDTSWQVARSVDEALALCVQHGYPAEMSVEYDLGNNLQTGLDFLTQIADRALRKWPTFKFPPITLSSHSNDVEGRCRMLGFWKSFQNKLARGASAIKPAPGQPFTMASAQPEASDPQRPKLIVAIASRALFDLDECHHIFEKQGAEAYARHQIEHEEIPLAPGVAFPLVRKLLALNTAEERRVEVMLASRNSADTGLRIFNSIRHHGLDISRAVFTRGESPYRYIRAFGAHLFLSASHEDVQKALDAGVAAATILPCNAGSGREGQLRIAFDGDAVLFSDEAERVYTEAGLDAFNRSEIEARERPLPGGPFKSFLAALHSIQTEFDSESSPIRTALVTARAAPAHERVIRTLRSWGIRIDEAMFLGGMSKGVFLDSFGADIFFDDQRQQCESAAAYIATGHVPYGVKNRRGLNAMSSQ